MKTTWVIVADASRARIFEASNTERALHEIETFMHPEGRAQNRELVAPPKLLGLLRKNLSKTTSQLISETHPEGHFLVRRARAGTLSEGSWRRRLKSLLLD